jgi:hypothetical protein
MICILIQVQKIARKKIKNFYPMVRVVPLAKLVSPRLPIMLGVISGAVPSGKLKNPE